jgi:hypothetical protein
LIRFARKWEPFRNRAEQIFLSRLSLEGSRVVVASHLRREESTFAGASDTSKGELGFYRVMDDLPFYEYAPLSLPAPCSTVPPAFGESSHA